MQVMVSEVFDRLAIGGETKLIVSFLQQGLLVNKVTNMMDEGKQALTVGLRTELVDYKESKEEDEGNVIDF